MLGIGSAPTIARYQQLISRLVTVYKQVAHIGHLLYEPGIIWNVLLNGQ